VVHGELVTMGSHGAHRSSAQRPFRATAACREVGKIKRALRGFSFASYRSLGGGTPAVVPRLQAAAVRARHRTGGVNWGVECFVEVGVSFNRGRRRGEGSDGHQRLAMVGFKAYRLEGVSYWKEKQGVVN
jgi:hypothetical protein